MRKVYYISIFIVLSLTIILHCSKTVGGGGTIETTNGIIGRIETEDSLPISGVIVKLIPENYNPVEKNQSTNLLLDTTDENGNYSFNNIEVGRYSIIARQLSTSKSVMKRNIIVEERSIIKLTEGILKKSASLCVKLYHTYNALIKEKDYLYIPGTDIFAYINNDTVILEDIPSGKFSEIILSYGENKKQNILRDTLNIEAGETKTIEGSLWKYRRKIVLNTAKEGANIDKNVYNFPLLIRLTKENFDFNTLTTPNISFTKNNGFPLIAEIERLDIDAKKAEIWVLIDTIYGNDSSQSIFMYWGNGETIFTKEGKVFDTTYDFQGVWHLEKSGDSVEDFTQNKYKGISSGTSIPKLSEGIIGNCLYFDGIDDFLTMPNTARSKLNFPEKGSYSVYAWVLLDTLDGASHCIVSKGYEQYYLRSTYISPNIKFTTPYWEFVEFGETDKWQASITPATTKEWCLLVGVRDGNKQLLYCNGELVDSTVDNWWNTVSRNTTNDLTIGKFAQPINIPINEGYCFFKGYIDEVRIINRALSPEWIKLCYMNQRPDDRLIIFKEEKTLH